MSILNMIIAQMPQGVADSVETLETLAESVTSTESVVRKPPQPPPSFRCGTCV